MPMNALACSYKLPSRVLSDFGLQVITPFAESMVAMSGGSELLVLLSTCQARSLATTLAHYISTH